MGQEPLGWITVMRFTWAPLEAVLETLISVEYGCPSFIRVWLEFKPSSVCNKGFSFPYTVLLHGDCSSIVGGCFNYSVVFIDSIFLKR